MLLTIRKFVCSSLLMGLSSLLMLAPEAHASFHRLLHNPASE